MTMVLSCLIKQMDKSKHSIPALQELGLTSETQYTVQGSQLLPSNVLHRSSGISVEHTIENC